MVKNGITTNINVRHQCITVMANYEKKSIEVVYKYNIVPTIPVVFFPSSLYQLTKTHLSRISTKLA